MKILVIPNNMINNCFGVRNELPMRYLSNMGHEIKFITSLSTYNHPKFGRVFDASNFDWCDVVVFNRHYDLALPNIKNFFEYCKKNGKKIIYETDDLLEAVDEHNPSHSISTESGDQIRYMIRNADICTTTVVDLQKELEKKSDNVVILPNCIEKKAWKLRKGKNKKVRVGWAGGSSHAKDMMIIIDVISRLQQEIDFEFAIFGLCDKQWDENIQHLKKRHEEQIKNVPNAKPALWYQAFMELDKQLKKVTFEHHPFVTHKDYNKKLSEMNLDIGLCPLEDTRFNRSKSAIKFYEYAMVGTACLASKIPPYESEVGYEAKNKFIDWYSKLKKLIIDEKFRKELQEKQYEWVLENRDIEKHVHSWEDTYLT